MTKRKNKEKRKCGLVMPISGMGDYTSEHWEEVKDILIEALSDEYDVSLVSETEEIGIIHNNIVRSLYESDIVICDISGRNPNVMFELGMRLAFDKPFVIIHDGCMNVPFDTLNIEYMAYPKDLNYARITTFKSALLEKVNKTLEKASNDSKYSILKEFGKFDIVRLPETDDKDTNINKMLNSIADELREVRSMLHRQDLRRSEARLFSPRNTTLSEDFLDSFVKIPHIDNLISHGNLNEVVDIVRNRANVVIPRTMLEKMIMSAYEKNLKK